MEGPVLYRLVINKDFQSKNESSSVYLFSTLQKALAFGAKQYTKGNWDELSLMSSIVFRESQTVYMAWVGKVTVDDGTCLKRQGTGPSIDE